MFSVGEREVRESAHVIEMQEDRWCISGGYGTHKLEVKSSSRLQYKSFSYMLFYVTSVCDQPQVVYILKMSCYKNK